MKRRLTSAYDHMTMPEACRQSIEKKLEESLKQQRTCRYTRVVSMQPPRKNRWVTAVAVICLILVLSVGGSMVFLKASDHLRMTGAETLDTETTHAETPQDHYALATSLSVEEVEAFAKLVRQDVLAQDWKTMASLRARYPVTIQGLEAWHEQDLVRWMEIFSLDPSFREALEAESCEAMFCNWQGISMAEGRIWINEVGGKLKITALQEEIQDRDFRKGQKKQVPLEFAPVLSGEPVKFTGNWEEITLEEYCEGLWGAGTPDRFTVADMDGDLTSEVVVSVQTEGKDTGFLVLRLEGQEICIYHFRFGEMYDIRKDGSFSRSSHGPSAGSFRLSLQGNGTSVITRDPKESEEPQADWHIYPCQGAELVLRSYEYVTGTGWISLPGMPYSYFEVLARKERVNDWDVLCEELTRLGMICLEEDGKALAFDPDAPGTALYGTLIEEKGYRRFETLGCYLCTPEREYQTEVREMLSGSPQYIVNAMDAQQESTVEQPESMTEYFERWLAPDPDGIAERSVLRTLAEKFTALYFADDRKTMETYLAEDYNGEKKGYASPGTAEIFAISYLPDHVIHIGGQHMIDVVLLEPGKDKYSVLRLDLVKQKDGWKVLTFKLEE